MAATMRSAAVQDVHALLMAHMDDGREAGDPGEMKKPGWNGNEQNIVLRQSDCASEEP